MVIKPSGVSYDELTRGGSMIVCDLDADVVEGDLSPVERHRGSRLRLPEHAARSAAWCTRTSTYASAWAARGEAVPCVLTAMADEFGGEIPIGPFALIGGDDIGNGIVETLSRATLAGGVDEEPWRLRPSARTAKSAVKAAVMCEDVTRTVHVASALGEPVPIAAERHRLAKLALPERLRAGT